MDVTEYADGRGKVKLRAKMEAKGEKQIVIKEIPFGTTTESSRLNRKCCSKRQDQNCRNQRFTKKRGNRNYSVAWYLCR